MAGTFVPVWTARGVVFPAVAGRVGVDCGEMGMRRDAAADDAGEIGIPGDRAELQRHARTRTHARSRVALQTSSAQRARARTRAHGARSRPHVHVAADAVPLTAVAPADTGRAVVVRDWRRKARGKALQYRRGYPPLAQAANAAICSGRERLRQWRVGLVTMASLSLLWSALRPSRRSDKASASCSADSSRSRSAMLAPACRRRASKDLWTVPPVLIYHATLRWYGGAAPRR